MSCKDKDSASTIAKSVDGKEIATWHQNNAKVLTWKLNSIDPSISWSLQAFTKAFDIWNHLRKLYHQTDKAKKLYLDTKIAKYCQGNKTIQWLSYLLDGKGSSNFLSQALKL